MALLSPCSSRFHVAGGNGIARSRGRTLLFPASSSSPPPLPLLSLPFLPRLPGGRSDTPGARLHVAPRGRHQKVGRPAGAARHQLPPHLRHHGRLACRSLHGQLRRPSATPPSSRPHPPSSPPPTSPSPRPCLLPELDGTPEEERAARPFHARFLRTHSASSIPARALCLYATL